MPDEGWKSTNIRDETNRIVQERVRLGKAKSISEYVDRAARQFAESNEFEDLLDGLKVVERLEQALRRPV